MWGRKILFPFSILYGGVVLTRNKLYDQHFFKSKNYDFPVICVGNLNVGGTGKSPMVEYLLKLLSNDGYKVASLSRGYKRSTTGFHLLNGSETAKMVGDEPLQFKTKFPNSAIAVDEDRQHGIAEIFKLKNPDVIVLDDAFQHRKVEAGLNILLTAYGDLYADDLVLPAGNLREPKTGASRADIIVVTKCPPDLTKLKMEEVKAKLKPEKHQQVFFASIKYADKVANQKAQIDLAEFAATQFTLVTGIANPAPLLKHLRDKDFRFEHLNFPDHHNFSNSEIEKINNCQKVLTTEKDYMRLKEKIDAGKLFYLPIQTHFLEAENVFNSIVLAFVKKKMG